MKWLIAVRLLALVPLLVEALRDGRLQPEELQLVGARLLAALEELLPAPRP